MNEVIKRLIHTFKNHKGDNFDATLQDDAAGVAGFHFMSYIKAAKIHIGIERLTVSEPLTGKYFCLPLIEIAEIHDESSGEYDMAYMVKYRNGYNVFIQIFKPEKISKENIHQSDSYYPLILEEYKTIILVIKIFIITHFFICQYGKPIIKSTTYTKKACFEKK